MPSGGIEYLLAAVFFVVAGVFIGAYGTIIGAGGGFLIVPLLFFLYPGEPPVTITSISLAVVVLNSISGSIAYGRQGRIDYRSGLIFAMVSVPTSVVGALTTALVPRQVFGPLFAVLLSAVAVYLFLNPRLTPGAGAAKPGGTTRRLKDAQGNEYQYGYDTATGLGFTALAALGSFFGIGGGILQVPVMIRLLSFPTAVATATSQFLITMGTASATVAHFVAGDLATGGARALFLGVGVVGGAQVGARLSRRLAGTTVVRMLALAQVLVAVRLLVG